MSLSFRTVVTSVRVELPKIKGSRFIAYLDPVADPSEAESALSEIRRIHPDASHHCWAYRLGLRGDEFRYHDDGEPSGTAGRPIHQHLEGQDVTRVQLVVVRYFGGTKLGAGGLVRAYGDAAAKALAAAEIAERKVTATVRVEHRYEDSASVSAFMTARRIEPRTADYSSTIRLVFEVPVDAVDGFVGELEERTGGRARVDVEGPP